MTALVHNIANVGRKLNKFDPVDRGVQNFVLGKPQYGNSYGQGPPAPPGPPSQDTAANAALQQNDVLRRRRGVMANIFAGGAAATPATSTKSTLGT